MNMAERTMTEKEIMLSGGMYHPLDELLAKERMDAHILTEKLNNTPIADTPAREALIKELFGSTGELITIWAGFHCDFGYNIHVGENFFCNFNCIMHDTNTITVGDNCMIGPNVTICTATHPIEDAARNDPDFKEYALPITIGDNVWIGAGSILLPGVTLGDRCVVAAGAVVAKDVPADHLVGGVPARIIKKIDNK